MIVILLCLSSTRHQLTVAVYLEFDGNDPKVAVGAANDERVADSDLIAFTLLLS